MQFRYRPAGRTARAFSSERRAPQGSRLGPVESFVDDLKPNRVLYGVRAALLQRSLEIQPAFFTIRYTVRIVFCVVFCILFSIFLCQMRAVRPPKAILVGKKMTWAIFGEIFFFWVGIYPTNKAVARQNPLLAPGWPSSKAYLLGLLAKIKCSICSYQLNLWYVAHGVTSD